MIGKTIGNYRIVKKLGTGGMGTVYLAENTNIGNKVAIKSLHQHLFENKTIRTRFLKEAKTQAILSHPNITRVIDYIDNNDGLFIILEYIEGDNLNDFIFKKRGLIPEKSAGQLMEKILDAVGYAHSKGVIHRDLKSSNIMVTPDNDLKIMDFGIAKLSGETLNLTKTGSRLGSPLYMSPEQVKGGNVDHRSDIYSLGVLYHEMLTGRPVYDQNNTTEFEIYEKILKQPLIRIKTIYKHVSDKAQYIVDKATDKLPDKRYQSCEEFKSDILNADIPLNISKESIPKSAYSKKTDKIRNGKNAIVIVSILLFINLIGIGGYSLLNNFSKKSNQKLEEAATLRKDGKYKQAYNMYKNAINFFNRKKTNDLLKAIEEESLQHEIKITQRFLNKTSGYKTLASWPIQDTLSTDKYEIISDSLNIFKKNENLLNNDNIEKELNILDIVYQYPKLNGHLKSNNPQKTFQFIESMGNIDGISNLSNLKNEMAEKLALLEKSKNDSILKTKEIAENSSHTYTYKDINTPPKTDRCNFEYKSKQLKCIQDHITNILNENINAENIKKWNFPKDYSFDYSLIFNKEDSISTINIKSSSSEANSFFKLLITEGIKNPTSGQNENGIAVNTIIHGNYSINSSLFSNPELPSEKEQKVTSVIKKSGNESNTESTNNIINKQIKTPDLTLQENVEEQTPVRIPSNLTIYTVDIAPAYPGCEDKEGIQLINCTSSNINNAIRAAIDENNLKGKGIPKGKHMTDISFRITNQGRIININVNSPYQEIRNETTRAVKTLSTMSTPAKYNDIPVSVNYNLSITITVQ